MTKGFKSLGVSGQVQDFSQLSILDLFDDEPSH